MAKTTVDVLITELCKRMAWDFTAASTPRADVLQELNNAEKYILQRYSLNFLTTNQSVNLLTAGFTAALPSSPSIDVGKDLTIQRPSQDGELTYVPVDEWFESGGDSYGDWITTQPSEFTLIGNGAGVLVINFRPANTTGGTLVYGLIGQMQPIALADSAGSTSLIPETFEATLLRKRAEGVLKRLHRRPGYQELLAEVEKDLEGVFYPQYRTTKEKAVPDREQQERKVAREKLAEGV